MHEAIIWGTSAMHPNTKSAIADWYVWKVIVPWVSETETELEHSVLYIGDFLVWKTQCHANEVKSPVSLSAGQRAEQFEVYLLSSVE
jgi:hypothetical protein